MDKKAGHALCCNQWWAAKMLAAERMHGYYSSPLVTKQLYKNIWAEKLNFMCSYICVILSKGKYYQHILPSQTITNHHGPSRLVYML